ncbi:MAG TPA: tRNA (adenosine(37)-N6)-threonylcarbamoyltransferase complex ATPase subunit type 1 TsaE [Candidatus Acidoferrales bacterium]|nr:tRNA (adenosine(37)-N6)-threonylcarbamoyltransferase complex ATPase subunit type 1 TsaE [Candidatus Acidoferrales bacterium]
MSSTEIISSSPEQTVEIGRELASRLRPPMLVLLSGELGSGKTTITKGIISGLGAAREEEVTSPTFTLVHVFSNHIRVYHVDLYRIEGFHDVESLALEDAFAAPAVIIVEWAERFSLRTNWPRVTIRLEHVEGDKRRIAIELPHP